MSTHRLSKPRLGILFTAFLALTASRAFAGANADIAVTKSNDTGGTASGGQTIQYTIDLHNNGPNGASKLIVQDCLDPHIINPTSNATQPDNCNTTDAPIAPVTCDTLTHILFSCHLQGVGNGGDQLLIITAQVDPATPVDTVITNCATSISQGGSGSTDDTPGNDTGCDGDGFTVVACQADLSITKTATDTNGDPLPDAPASNSVVGGTNFKYHIVVQNNGAGDADNSTVTDTLPTGVTYVSSSPNTGSCDATAIPLLTCNLGTIGTGASSFVDITVTANNSGPIINTATAAADGECGNANDNSSDATVNVQTVNMPTALEADRESSTTDTDCITTDPISTSSDVNRVFEPGEEVRIDPTWHNTLDNADPDVKGTADTPTSPSGGTLTIEDCTADYGAIPANSDADCNSATTDCYQMKVTEDVAGVRPHLADHARHWDTTFHETLSSGETKTWTLHIGDTFPDVPRSNGFYRFIETILHNRITIGCQNGNFFCPADLVVRAQVAGFIARSLAGNDTLVPTSSATYDCTDGVPPSQFTDVPISSVFCKHINYLKDAKVVFGCTLTTFCPNDPASRGVIAVAIARAAEVKLGNTADPDGSIPLFGNSTDGTRVYNCDIIDHTNTFDSSNIPAGTPPFTDVPTSGDVCKSVGLLFVNRIVDGFGDGTFHPTENIRRDQAAKILTNEFVNLPLYGPLTF